MLDNVKAIEGCAEIDAVQDHLGDIGVVDTGSLRKSVRILLDFKHKTQSSTHLEDCGSVVEEVIGTCELLEHLQEHSKRDTLTHLGSREHMNPLSDESLLRSLGTEFSIDLFEFEMDTVMIGRCSVNLQHGLFGPLCLAISEIESRGFREQKH